MKFAEKLYRWIQERGKTQGAVARQAGLSASAVTDMTAGRRRPYLDQGLRLARALDLSLDYLADDDLDEPPDPPLTEDERAVLDLYRALELDRVEALRRLAGGGRKQGRS